MIAAYLHFFLLPTPFPSSSSSSFSLPPPTRRSGGQVPFLPQENKSSFTKEKGATSRFLVISLYLLWASVMMPLISARRFRRRLGAFCGSSERIPMNERYIGLGSKAAIDGGP